MGVGLRGNGLGGEMICFGQRIGGFKNGREIVQYRPGVFVLMEIFVGNLILILMNAFNLNYDCY